MIAMPEQGPNLAGASESDFSGLEKSLVDHFFEAVAAQATDERYLYFVNGGRRHAAHSLAVICVADSVEPLRARKTEKLRVGIPVEKPDSTMPVPVLGQADAHYFYLSYIARRGGLKDLLITPEVYAKRFTGRAKPPVRNLADKLTQYTVVPMREREPEEGLTE